MLAMIRNNVLLDITAVPSTQINRIRLKMIFVTLNTLFHISISEDVKLSSDLSRKTSHGFDMLKRKKSVSK